MNANERPDPAELSADLSAYLDGELSPAEVDRVEQALERDPELRAELELLEEVSATLRGLAILRAPSSVLEGIRRETRPRHHALVNFGSWAALFLVAAVGLLGWGLGMFDPETPERFHARQDAPSTSDPEVRIFEKPTASGGILEESEESLAENADFLGTLRESERVARMKLEPHGNVSSEVDAFDSDVPRVTVGDPRPGAPAAVRPGESGAFQQSEPAGGLVSGAPSLEEEKSQNLNFGEDETTLGERGRARAADEAASSDLEAGVGQSRKRSFDKAPDEIALRLGQAPDGQWSELSGTGVPGKESLGVDGGVRYRWILEERSVELSDGSEPLERREGSKDVSRARRSQTGSGGRRGDSTPKQDVARRNKGEADVQNQPLEDLDAYDLTIRVPLPETGEAVPYETLPRTLAVAIAGELTADLQSAEESAVSEEPDQEDIAGLSRDERKGLADPVDLERGKAAKKVEEGTGSSAVHEIERTLSVPVALEIEVPEDRLLETVLALRAWHQELRDDSTVLAGGRAGPPPTEETQGTSEPTGAAAPQKELPERIEAEVRRELLSLERKLLGGFAYEAESGRLGLLLDELSKVTLVGADQGDGKSAPPTGRESGITVPADDPARREAESYARTSPTVRPLRIRILLEPMTAVPAARGEKQ